MSNVEPDPKVSRQPDGTPPIKPIETIIVVGAFMLLVGNVWADWQSSDYSGGMVSVGLIVLIGAILGKNVGSLVGGGK